MALELQGKSRRVLYKQYLIVLSSLLFNSNLDSIGSDYHDDKDGEGVRRLLPVSVCTGTYKLPTKWPYAYVYTNLDSSVIQMHVPLISRRNLPCYPAGLCITLLLSKL